MPDTDQPSSALSGLGSSPIKITTGSKPGALPTVSLTSGASIDPNSSTSILGKLEEMIAERQNPYNKFRNEIDTMIAHTGYMPTERIKADAELRQNREADLANLVMNKAQLQSGLQQGEAIRNYLNAPQGGVGGAGATTGGASPMVKMIASLPAAEQDYGRLLAATDPNALFKLVHENQLKRPDLQKGFEYANTLPEDQKQVYLGQLLEKGLAPRSYIDPKTGEEHRFSPAASMPGGAPARAAMPTAGGAGVDAEAWAKSQGIPISPNGGNRTFNQQVDQFVQNPNLAAAPGTSPHEQKRAVDVPAQFRTPEVKAKLEKAGFTAPLANEPWHFELPKNVAPIAAAPATTAPAAAPAAQGTSVEALKLREDALKSSSKSFHDNDYKVITERAEAAKEIEKLSDQVLDNIKGNDYGPGTDLNQKLAKYYQVAGGKLDQKDAEKYVSNMNIETARKFLSAQSARQAMGAQFTAQEAGDWLNAFAGIDSPKDYLKNFYQVQKAGAMVDQDVKNYLLRNKGREQDAYIEWQDSGRKDKIMRENVDAFKKGKPSEQKAAEAPKAQKPASAPADAKLAGDGNWYAPDPNRKGKYLMWKGESK